MIVPDNSAIALYHHAWADLQRGFDFHPDEIELVERAADKNKARYRREGLAICAIIIAGAFMCYAGLSTLEMAISIPLLMVGGMALSGGIGALRGHKKSSRIIWIDGKRHWSIDPESLKILPAYSQLLKALPAGHALIPDFLKAAHELALAETALTVADIALAERLAESHPAELMEQMIEHSKQQLQESPDADMHRLLEAQIKRLHLQKSASSRVEDVSGFIDSRRKQIKEAKRCLQNLAVKVAEGRRNERQLEGTARQIAELSAGHLDAARTAYDHVCAVETGAVAEA